MMYVAVKVSGTKIKTKTKSIIAGQLWAPNYLLLSLVLHYYWGPPKLLDGE